MRPYKRSIRVGDLLKEEIADIIMHKLKDPRLGFITVTGVDVSNDLKHAKVYVSILEDVKRSETLKILISSAKFIRSELGRKVRIKYLPDIIFKLDESLEYGAKISKILNEIKESTDSSKKDDENPT